jgi:hypothetical protein
LVLSWTQENYYFDTPYRVSAEDQGLSTGLSVFATKQFGYLNGKPAEGANAQPECSVNFTSDICQGAKLAALSLLGAMIFTGLAFVSWSVSTATSGGTKQKSRICAKVVAVLAVILTFTGFALSNVASAGVQEQMVMRQTVNLNAGALKQAYAKGNETLAASIKKVDVISEAISWNQFGKAITAGPLANEPLTGACPIADYQKNATLVLMKDPSFVNATKVEQETMVAVAAAPEFVPCIVKITGDKFPATNLTVHSLVYPKVYVQVISGALNTTEIPADMPLEQSKTLFIEKVTGAVKAGVAAQLAIIQKNLGESLVSTTRDMKIGYYTTVSAGVISTIATGAMFLL